LTGMQSAANQQRKYFEEQVIFCRYQGIREFRVTDLQKCKRPFLTHLSV
jgi:hypothetical protein